MRILLLLVPSLALAAAPEKPCVATPFHAADFFLGTWDVTRDGKPSGSDVVTSILDGCALEERFSDGGWQGRSLLYYDRGSNQWRQLWLDSQGTALTLHGSGASDRLVLLSDGPPPGQPARQDRVTYQRLSATQVRQLHEVTFDAGKSWKPLFDGLFTRREKP